MVSVLFVCLGNICRSPTAEGVFRQLVTDAGLGQVIRTDSAGTGAWHVGKAPDARATAAAQKRGYRIDDLRARQVCADDFTRFDYVLAMDAQNLKDLRELAPNHAVSKPRLFLEFSDAYTERDVPDPYYGGAAGFDHVLDLVTDASAGLLSHLREIHAL